MTDGWTLRYEGFDPGTEGLRETLCALGNGYLCSRAAAPDVEAGDVHYPATYLAGGYNRAVSMIGDQPIENEDLVNLPNWTVLRMRIGEGDWLSPESVEILDYAQELRIAEGLLVRSIRFRDPGGRVTRWEERRFVSMADPHLMGLSVAITPEDWAGAVTLRSAMDGTVINAGVKRYRALESRHLETTGVGVEAPGPIWLRTRFRQARVEIGQAARLDLWKNDAPHHPDRIREALADMAVEETTVALAQGETLRADKLATLHTGRDDAISEPALAAREAAADAPDFEAALEDHRHAWRRLWDEFDLHLDTGDGEEQNLKLRLHLFHLLQTVSRHSIDRDAGVPPRGWTGEAYRAHIMWDELFIFPILTLREPLLTRALLLYRHRRLDAARRLARAEGYAGAMYPWMSGSDGREETQTLHLNPKSGRWLPDNSRRQRHVNAAIAFNAWQYFEATDDREFLADYGAEMLAEIARFWASASEWSDEKGRYVIRGVMGPDEFHEAYPGRDPSTEGGLDNNAYTNVMAAWTLTRAVDALDIIPTDRRRALCERLGVTREEIDLWQEISRRLYVPFHADGLISQFEGYEALEEFDWEGYRARYGDIHRLDRILEAEGDSPNRYKLAKQADTLMLFYLFSAEELDQLFEQLGYAFDPRDIPRTVEYYAARTSHGSTLSWVVHSWVMARTDRRGSWRLFCDALDADIADVQGGTTPEGVHLGAMCGTVDLCQRCYAGVEVRGNALHVNPLLPAPLKRLTARLRYRRQDIDLEVTQERLRLASRPSNAGPVTVAYRGRYREMTPGATVEFALVGAPGSAGET